MRKSIKNITNKFVIASSKLLYVVGLSMSLSLSGCVKDYLDVVPDNIATIDHAFANRYEAERYLYTCYSWLPKIEGQSIYFFGADDVWTWSFNHESYQWPWQIAMGRQNASNPLVDAWNGQRSGYSFFKAIRDCNVFIENVSDTQKILDLNPQIRKRWIAEAKVLKAYYHFFLFRMYGPIPIVDMNLPMDSPTEVVRVKREPVDKIVNYIAALLDEAAPDLPTSIEKMTTEAGRLTRAACLMLKARALTTAASPLFNGNTDFATFKNKDGQNLFPTSYSEEKWKKAADACSKALDVAVGVKLYEYTKEMSNMSSHTKKQLNIRGAVTEKWNSELIWGRSGNINSANLQEKAAIDMMDPSIGKMTYQGSYFSVTLNMVERFYSNNGIPIDEDKTWDYAGRYELKKATDKEKDYLEKEYTTSAMNFSREPRFYGSLGFDGGLWLQETTGSGYKNWMIHGKFGQNQAKQREMYYNETGYWIKKLVGLKFTPTNTGYTTEAYPWPEMRLADLYLLYAECLNEIGNGDDAIYYLDIIRQRAGLKGVKESWQNYSTRPNKFASKDGLREIIHQEREIELAFEGSRLWDLRRWKEAALFQNKPVKGWTITGKQDVEYYRARTLFSQQFIAPRDYFWPIEEQELYRNNNLVQNPGW
ncbi:RagB/SusD family nutrient uptake outer membrane protein [Sphingobacterium puteale]|uniref:RagB/SusD family nutrient uptake outer membrane protein n=1 Tax=Sphingobacterium puteale TaxID=2420510 RepID=A0A420W4E8_9SPHI|nr:RagB/SusD family nutrient uptake outer membrane protein [Sphingobacterium puteale]RKO73404.1 RagB/SusD family nutrient uptake outer membrane protein [Sphingobacterium puteale]